MGAVKAADPSLRTSYVAIDEPKAARPYGPEVKFRIRQGEADNYRGAAQAINAMNVDIVNLQHEFGLYGVHQDGRYDDHLQGFLEEIRKPVLTTLHTVLPQPPEWMRESVSSIAERSTAVIVMVETAARLLLTDYGVPKRPLVVPHGMPAIVPAGRRVLKKQLGMADRTIISTFGLVDPRKGLEYVIEAMPDIAARRPNVLYLIVGQTHPELLRRHGEAYRNSVIDLIDRLGVRSHVAFVNEYLTQKQIVEYLLATDVYVTPYLDPNQITSGTLAYALGAGKAIVSTPYLHAREALAAGRGLLVDFRSSAQIAAAVGRILDDPELKGELERRSYEYGKEMAWPNVGRRVLEVMRGLLEQSAPAPAAAGGVRVA
jgi:glycosyltransferase involved in cell wall biosynthesis